MVFKLAWRNFFHDRVSLTVTLVGIVFSVVLMTVETGLYNGTQKVITNIIDHSGADLWITPVGAESFDDAPLLKGGEKYAALGVPGVAAAYDLGVDMVGWQKDDGTTQAVVIVGSDPTEDGLKAWNVIRGDPSAITRPGGVIVEKTYLKKLGVKGVGDTAMISGQKVTVVAVTDRIRSFTTLPYVFTTLERSRDLIGARPDQSGFVMVRIKPDADLKTVQAALKANLRKAEVLTSPEFVKRSINRWMFTTGAGSALIAGALLALIVGIVVVAQTLYASTKDHLNEFATLRALGASSSYIVKVILFQALFSALLGFTIGMAISYMVVWLTWETYLNIRLTPELAAILFGVTLAMCILSAISAILKVTRIDPAMVFTR
jgi:putative ABC transport system permease protein